MAAAIYAADVIARHKLSLAGEKRRNSAIGHGREGHRGRVIERIDWLLADEMVSTL